MSLLHDKIYSSQHEEERFIQKYLEKNPDKEMGTYVDIGAGQPCEINNTYYYYCRGWNGLLVEPHPRYAEKIKITRPRDIFEPVAISNYDGIVQMCDTATIGSFIGDDYKRTFPVRCYNVKCMTMNTLSTKYPQFLEADILNIDIETNEDKALSQCNFEKIKPKIILIEFQVRGVDYRKNWEHYILPYYDFQEIIPDSSNAIYTRKKENI
jgi:hypothetical protein